jgi:hypothetical protein
MRRTLAVDRLDRRDKEGSSERRRERTFYLYRDGGGNNNGWRERGSGRTLTTDSFGLEAKRRCQSVSSLGLFRVSRNGSVI